MDAIAFIFARAGSKGLPQKNKLNFCGKPLIAWTIEQALGLPSLRRIIVSTDDPEILEIALAYGAETPFTRPKDLATDTSPERLSWRHALQFVEAEEGKLPDAMVTLPVTSPLRDAEDIEKCLNLFARGNVDTVITYREASRNPYFNMIEVSPDATAKLPLTAETNITRRQEAPKIFDMTTVAYVSKPEVVLSTDSIFDTRVKGIFIPQERSIDIDTRLDFEIAEYLMKKRLGSIE